MSRRKDCTVRQAVAVLERLPQPALVAVVKRLVSRLEPVEPDPNEPDETRKLRQELHELWWAARQRRRRRAVMQAGVL